MVGNDFFVFLYLDICEEYVFVCIECKSGYGYGGFVFYIDIDVMLEDDLIWCDFIINVMVRMLGGEIIDFFNGKWDLKVCLFCYVLLVFVEDLLCVLCVVCFVVCY